MKYYVESYGCTMNFGEGEELAERMDALGHVRTSSADDADIVILNTCTVVETTEKRMIKRMNDLRAAGKEVIVTGCMAKVQPNRVLIRLPGALVIPPQEYSGFSDAVAERYGCHDSIPSPRNATTAIIPIAQGCRGNCTYCITRFARGGLKSYDPASIKERFDRLVDGGAREILITAQDTGCYGIDIGTDLGELIRLLLTKEGDYRIRIGMMNPNSLKPVLNSLLPVFEDRRVYRFLHIPVQSGSDAVLERMRKHYTAGDFFQTVETIRERYPDLSIYEPVPSEIRTIQRRGRTGRKNDGEVFVLVASGTMDEAMENAARRKEEQMKERLENLGRGLKSRRGPATSQRALDGF